MSRYREVAELLKLIAHPMRLEILDHLRRSPECVCHLSALLGRPQPYISQQLALMRRAGVISDQKDGTNVYYRISDDRVIRQIEAALDAAPSGTRTAKPAKREAVAGCPCPQCVPAAPLDRVKLAYR